MEEIKYDNKKLCRRNFNFIDHLIDKGFNFLILGFVSLIILGIWFDFPLIVTKLLWSDIFLFVFCLFWGRIKYLTKENGELEYYDDYSKVIETPKKGEKQQLNG